MSKNESIPKVYGFKVFEPKSDKLVIGSVYFDMPLNYYTEYQGPLIQKKLNSDEVAFLEKILDETRLRIEKGDKP